MKMNNRKIRSCHCSDGIRFVAAAVLLALSCLPSIAQERLELLPGLNCSVSTVSFGMGSAASLDTYLSPSEYTGAYLSGEYDRLTLVKKDAFFPYRHLYMNFGFGNLKNHAGTNVTAHVMAHVYGSWSHLLVSDGIWESLLGVSALADVGGLMNRANSNNPANALVQLSSGATFYNIVHFTVKSRPMAAKGTVHLPLLGLGFAPEHDQFYWNMVSQGSTRYNIRAVTPFSAQTMSVQLALDVPVSNRVMQFGYNMYLMRNRLGGNFSGLIHSYVTVGFVHRFEKLKWK